MGEYFKALVLAGSVVIIYLLLDKQNKDMAVMITLCGCCMVIMAAVCFLEPVISFIGHVREIADLDGDLLKILMKATSVAIISEIAAQICHDAGNTSIGKTVNFLAITVIVWLSIPLFTELLDMLSKILGEL